MSEETLADVACAAFWTVPGPLVPSCMGPRWEAAARAVERAVIERVAVWIRKEFGTEDGDDLAADIRKEFFRE